MIYLFSSFVFLQCVFTGPTQKSSKYGTGPPTEKMTKYTGPTQKSF